MYPSDEINLKKYANSRVDANEAFLGTLPTLVLGEVGPPQPLQSKNWGPDEGGTAGGISLGVGQISVRSKGIRGML